MGRIQQIYINRSIAHLPLVREIVGRFNVTTSVIDDPDSIYDFIRSQDDPVAAGKNILFLTENKGSFIRECPGTRNYTCCDYMILHIGTFCTMDCAYCILQSYFHPPVLQYFVNQEKMYAELDLFLSTGQHRRIGTGEYTDSMIWELWTGLSKQLIPIFASQSHAVLELKTKTNNIENLRNIRHNRRTIISWSVNTPRIIQRNERGTASLGARIQAAAQCQEWGYPLAFHFDPLVEYNGCHEDYRLVINQIFDHIQPDNIAWISLGALRFMPDLKPIIQTRFPDSKIVYGEFIAGMDGKSRYLRSIRTEIYKDIVNSIRERAPEVTIYFCMESEDVWKQVFGFTTRDYGGLSHMLDESAVKICQLEPKSGGGNDSDIAHGGQE